MTYEKQQDKRVLKMWYWFSNPIWLHHFIFIFFHFIIIFFNNGDRLSVKLKEKGAKLYSEWFICTLGGLTLCPVVNGDRKGFLFMFYFNN